MSRSRSGTTGGDSSRHGGRVGRTLWSPWRADRAIQARPGHVGAVKALARLSPGETPAGEAPLDEFVEPVGLLQFGVFEYLRQDKSMLSKQALDVMETLRHDAHPHASAYLGQLITRVAVFVMFALIAAALTQVDRIDLPNSRVLVLDLPSWAPIAVLLVGAIPILWKLLVVLTMRIRIDKGRLQLEKGILTRKVTNLELWRVTDVNLEQGFWNRLTGDGNHADGAAAEEADRAHRPRPRPGAEGLVSADPEPRVPAAIQPGGQGDHHVDPSPSSERPGREGPRTPASAWRRRGRTWERRGAPSWPSRGCRSPTP